MAAVIGNAVTSQAINMAIDWIYADTQRNRILDFRKTGKFPCQSFLDNKFRLAREMSAKDIAGIDYAVKATIGNDFEQVLNWMGEGIRERAGGMYATLWDAWNGATQLLNSYHSIIQGVGIDPYIKRSVNSQVQPNIPDVEKAWQMYRLGNLPYDVLETIAHMNGWGTDWLYQLNFVFQAPLPLGVLLDLYRRKAITKDDFKWQLNLSRVDEHRIEGIITLATQMPDTQIAAMLAAKGIMSDEDLHYAAAWHGIQDRWADGLKVGQYTFPDFNTGLNLLWRGVIDSGKLLLWLKRQAITDEDAGYMLKLAEQIPPSQDLVTMVVREAWEPANVTPAPDIFAKYMAMRGFSKDWSDRYWTAHWLPMPIQYGYANLHRGFWTKEQFDELLRIADIHPRWREAIYNVAFLPPTIRELGYGYDVGVYSLDDIKMYRRWGGLSEKDAEKSSLAMVAYRTEAEREAVRRDYLHLYVNGNISREDFETALKSIGTVSEGVPLWLERGDLEIELKSTETSITEPKNITRADAQWLFENGLRDETFLRETLRNLGYLDESIDAYADQSKKRIADKVKPPEVLTPKTLTLAQMRDLYYLGKINAEQFTQRLISLRYTPEDAAAIVALADLEKPTPKEPPTITRGDIADMYSVGWVDSTEVYDYFIGKGYTNVDATALMYLTVLSVEVPMLKAQYSKGWITAANLYNGLLALGVPDDRADNIMKTIVKYEQPARTTSEKDLTKAEIVKGVKVGVVTPQEGVSLLQGLGYDENEAWYILAINKVVSAGDPEGYWDMRRVVEAAKKARGEASVQIPDELVALEKQRKAILAQLDRLKASKAAEEEIGSVAVQLAGIESRMRTIVAKLKLA